MTRSPTGAALGGNVPPVERVRAIKARVKAPKRFFGAPTPGGQRWIEEKTRFAQNGLIHFHFGGISILWNKNAVIVAGSPKRGSIYEIGAFADGDIYGQYRATINPISRDLYYIIFVIIIAIP